MKRKILIAFYFLMTHCGIIRFFYWMNRQKKLVLTYHNIIPDELFDHSLHLGVSHSEFIFEKQVKLIRKRFIREGESQHCLITFDDGYKNQFEIASKILNRYSLQGIFFISFQLITTGQVLIIDKMMMWVSYVPVGNYTIFGTSITISDVNRPLIASKIYNQLLENFALWNTIEEELNRSFSFAMLSINPKLAKLRFEPLKPDDLERLTREGHLVGSHSFSHHPLGILPLEMQREDFSKCVSFANKYCNCKLYSYPFGGVQEVSPLTAKLCAGYGFNAAYMNVSEAPAWLNVNNNYILPRFSLPNESNPYLLDAKLSGFESFCKKILKAMYTKTTAPEVFYDAKR